MPLNVGETGFGGVPEGGLVAGVGNSETAPLLIPEPDPEPVYQWQPLSKGELETAAGGPGWRRARCYLVVLFWIAWVSMLAISVAIVVMSPRPVGTSLKWWQRTVYYRLQPDLSTEAQAEGSEGVSGKCEWQMMHNTR